MAGLAVPLCGIVKVPVRMLAPAGPLKFTVIVQVEPTARVVNEQVSVTKLNALPVTLANEAEPKVTGAPLIVNVTVSNLLPLRLPNASVPLFKLAGPDSLVKATVPGGAMPEPLSGTGALLTVALVAVMPTVPL